MPLNAVDIDVQCRFSPVRRRCADISERFLLQRELLMTLLGITAAEHFLDSLTVRGLGHVGIERDRVPYVAVFEFLCKNQFGQAGFDKDFLHYHYLTRYAALKVTALTGEDDLLVTL